MSTSDFLFIMELPEAIMIPLGIYFVCLVLVD